MISNEKKKCVQIGTVMTDENYRGRGLSKALMEIIIKDYKDNVDYMYLFANGSAKEFYPKFNFVESKEYEYSILLEGRNNEKLALKELDMEDKKDREFVYRKICSSKPQYDLSMLNYPSLNMFHFTYFMVNSVYYIEEMDALISCDSEEDAIFVHDIYCSNNINIDKILDYLPVENQKVAVLGFTPFDKEKYTKELFKIE